MAHSNFEILAPHMLLQYTQLTRPSTLPQPGDSTIKQPEEK